MTVSTKRARQRAKKAAADGGSHQRALDAIARDEGHAHWGAMSRAEAPRNAETAARARASAATAAEARFPSEDRRDAVELVAPLISGGGAQHVMISVLLNDFLLGLDGGRGEVMQPHGSFAESVARLMSDNGIGVDPVDVPGDDRALALFERFRAGASAMGYAPEKLDALLGEVTVSDMADLSVRAERFARQRDFGRVLDASRLSDAAAAAVVAVHAPVSTLSSFQFDLLDRLVSPLRSFSHDDLIMSEREIQIGGLDLVSAAASLLHARSKSGARAMRVARIAFAERGGDDGFAFAGMTPPEVEGVSGAWAADAFDKMLVGRRPFSFNPLTTPLERGEKIDGAILPFVEMATTPADRHVAEHAVAFVGDVARIIRSAGPAAVEVGAVASSGVVPSVSLVNVHHVIERLHGAPDQIRLFASIHGMKEVPGISAAVADPLVLLLARRAMAPFGHPALELAAG